MWLQCDKVTTTTVLLLLALCGWSPVRALTCMHCSDDGVTVCTTEQPCDQGTCTKRTKILSGGMFSRQYDYEIERQCYASDTMSEGCQWEEQKVVMCYCRDNDLCNAATGINHKPTFSLPIILVFASVFLVRMTSRKVSGITGVSTLLAMATLVLTVVLPLIQRVDAFVMLSNTRCYQMCSGNSLDTCMDRECPSGVCVKAHSGGTITRDCLYFVEYNLTEVGCSFYTAENTTMPRMECYCDSDLCNAAGTLFPTPLVRLLSVTSPCLLAVAALR